MKGHFVIQLFTMLILFFCSCSAFADLNLDFAGTAGDSYIRLKIYYNDDIRFIHSENADFLYGWNPPPTSHDYLISKSFDDCFVGGVISAYYGYIFENKRFTINLSTVCSVNELQPVESLQWQSLVTADIVCPWSIDLESVEMALMKIEIIGATWDGSDPYFYFYCSDQNSQPLHFEYDGKYYTTHLNSGDYHTVAAIVGSLSSTNLMKNTQINYTFEVVPVPSAFILGIIGLGYSSWRLRKKPE